MSKSSYWRGLKTGNPDHSDVLILGVPFDGAVSNARGAAEAPDRLRELSIKTPPLSEQGLDLRELVICDQGNVTVDPDWNRYYNQVEQQAAELMAKEKFLLFLGGDHSVTIPLGKAFAEHYSSETVGMIHLDSHCDLMDIYDGSHWSHACPQRRFLEHENISPDNLVMVGIRNYEAEELVFLKDNPAITVIGARQCYFQDHKLIMEQIYKAMRGIGAVYLSIDIDVLDPAFAPGTGTPEAGGLSTREVIEMTREIVINLPVKAVDLVEVAPPIDHSNITSWSALKIIYEIFSAIKHPEQ